MRYTVLGANIAGTNSTYIAQGINDTNGWMEFRANDVPEHVAAYTQLYDQYKLKKIVVRFTPVNPPPMAPMDGSAAVTTSEYNAAFFATVLDYDGAYPSTFDAMREYQQTFRYQSTIARKPVVRVIYPKIRMTGVVVGGSASNSIVEKSRWVDVQDGGVAHFGLAWFIGGRQQATAWGQLYRVTATYHLLYKNNR